MSFELEGEVRRLEYLAQSRPGAHRRRVWLWSALGYGLLGLFPLSLLGLGATALLAARSQGCLCLQNASAALTLAFFAVLGALGLSLSAFLVRLAPPTGIPLRRADAPALFSAIESVAQKVGGSLSHTGATHTRWRRGSRGAAPGVGRDALVPSARPAAPGEPDYRPARRRAGPRAGAPARRRQQDHARRRPNRGDLGAARRADRDPRRGGGFSRGSPAGTSRVSPPTRSPSAARTSEAPTASPPRSPRPPRSPKPSAPRRSACGFSKTRFRKLSKSAPGRWPNPPEKLFRAYVETLRAPLTEDDARDAVFSALGERLRWDEAHPLLAERLIALGQVPAAPAPPEVSAAQTLLQPGRERFLDILDALWRKQATPEWRQAFLQARALKRERLALEERIGVLDGESRLRHALLVELFDGARFAVPYLEKLKSDPVAGGRACLALGRIRLAAGEASGVALVESALLRVPEQAQESLALLHDFHRRRGDSRAARDAWKRGEALETARKTGPCPCVRSTKAR